MRIHKPERWRALLRLDWPVWTPERILPLDAFAKVKVPALAVFGEDDEFFAPRAALELADALPNSEVAVLPGGTHSVFRERPAIFHATVAEFIPRGMAESPTYRGTDAPVRHPRLDAFD